MFMWNYSFIFPAQQVSASPLKPICNHLFSEAFSDFTYLHTARVPITLCSGLRLQTLSCEISRCAGALTTISALSSRIIIFILGILYIIYNTCEFDRLSLYTIL